MINKENIIVLADGRITCARCQAMNRRKLQCSKPALRNKRVCGQHGGKSTGAKTTDGKEKSRLARVKSGAYTKDSKSQHSKALLNLATIEDCCFALGLFIGEKTRGRRPLGYKKITNPYLAIETIMNMNLRIDCKA